MSRSPSSYVYKNQYVCTNLQHSETVGLITIFGHIYVFFRRKFYHCSHFYNYHRWSIRDENLVRALSIRNTLEERRSSKKTKFSPRPLNRSSNNSSSVLLMRCWNLRTNFTIPVLRCWRYKSAVSIQLTHNAYPMWHIKLNEGNICPYLFTILRLQQTTLMLDTTIVRCCHLVWVR